METLQYCIRKMIYGIPLIIGVTLISFTLMVYFGPDKTFTLISKNATEAEIQEVRHRLGYDQPFVVRYKDFLVQLANFDFGNSDSTGERVDAIFAKTIPVTLALSLPGFVLGNILAIILALFSAYHRGKWEDKLVMVCSVIGMSISILIVIIVFQIIFCSTYGLDLFPVTGWEVNGPLDYLKYVTVPTMSTMFVALGYNTRFYRAVFVEELGRDHVRTAKAFGCPPIRLLRKHIFRNALIPIVTRIVFTIPFIIIGGSLLVESYFGIPGVGLSTFDAITTGDQPILKAVVSMTAIMYVMILTVIDVIYRMVDPRIQLS